jgi:ABC-2 type transport system ATP-binding protein
MIEANRLTRRYGDFVAVDDVSFRIEPGEIVGLLGHNGAGKSTIMKMLTGFLEPSSGSVTVDGVELERDPVAVQQNMGYLPENLPLYPELTVMDYLQYAAELRQIDARPAVANAIDATELREKALDPISTLSRGYRQRVGVAQAILHKPRFLILDEPTNGLDPGQTQHMRQLIQDLAASATVILSTHIMQEVSAICDRALIVRDGRLVLDERLEDLQATQRLSLQTEPSVAVGELISNGVESLGDGRWLIEVVDPRSEAESIAKTLIGANAPIYELSPTQRDLETVFREVNEEVVSDAV